MTIEEELKKAGLKERQALVYLSLLKSGPGSIQRISRKANIARATTYVIIDSLMSMGLVSRKMTGKRPLFYAEEPDRLLHIMEMKQRSLKQYQQEIKKVIPSLEALYRTNSNLSVQYFSGREGLKVMRQEMIMQCSKGDVWFNLTSADLLKNVFNIKDQHCKGRLAKGIRFKTLFTTSNPDEKKYFLSTAKKHKTERKYVPPEQLTIATGISIFRDKVAIGSFSDTIGGMIIQSEALANTMRSSMDVIWSQTES